MKALLYLECVITTLKPGGVEPGLPYIHTYIQLILSHRESLFVKLFHVPMCEFRYGMCVHEGGQDLMEGHVVWNITALISQLRPY